MLPRLTSFLEKISTRKDNNKVVDLDERKIVIVIILRRKNKLKTSSNRENEILEENVEMFDCSYATFYFRDGALPPRYSK